MTDCNLSCFDCVCVCVCEKAATREGDSAGIWEITEYSIDRVTFCLQGCRSSTCMGLGDLMAFTTRGMDAEGAKG